MKRDSLPTYLWECVPHHEFSRRFYGFPSSNSLEVRATTQAFIHARSGSIYQIRWPQKELCFQVQPLPKLPSRFSPLLCALGSLIIVFFVTDSQTICLLTLRFKMLPDLFYYGPFHFVPRSPHYIMVLCHFDLFPTLLFHLAALQPQTIRC